MAAGLYFCGEIVADFLEQKSNQGTFDLTLGGSPFNSALGAKNTVEREGLANTVGFVGPISTDMLGDRFFNKLAESNISTEGVSRVDRQTTLALVSIKPGTENAFSFYSRGGADEMVTRQELPKAPFPSASSDPSIFCFGSISTVIEPARFAWKEFAQEQASKSVVFYDLNTRPSIAKDPVAYQKIVAEWASTAHVMKASDADIAWTYPGKSMQDVANIWLDEGAKVAVFTAGGNGSYAFTRDHKVYAESPALIPASTVGAGDNFNAGFAVHLAKEGITKPEAITAISADTLTRVLSGANMAAAHHLMSIGAVAAPVRPAPSVDGSNNKLVR